MLNLSLQESGDNVITNLVLVKLQLEQVTSKFLLHGTIVGYITPYIITKKSLQLYSTQKMNFSVKNVFSKCREI